MPQRRFKPRVRKHAVRDARLIIIAAEGSECEPKYFYDLAFDARYRNPKVRVEVLQRDTTASSPAHVIAALDEFRKTYALDENDELWLVIDLDRWGDEAVSNVAAQCQQKRYLLAVSNPSFEIWLLLHLTALDAYTEDDLKELTENRRDGNRTRLERELVRLVGQYNKSNLNTEAYLPHVETAIARASDSDSSPNHRWTNHLGTRVYQLARSVIAREKPPASEQS
jgi:hypothetical protein